MRELGKSSYSRTTLKEVFLCSQQSVAVMAGQGHEGHWDDGHPAAVLGAGYMEHTWVKNSPNCALEELYVCNSLLNNELS